MAEVFARTAVSVLVVGADFGSMLAQLAAGDDSPQLDAAAR